jgi:hypothetical protein
VEKVLGSIPSYSIDLLFCQACSISFGSRKEFQEDCRSLCDAVRGEQVSGGQYKSAMETSGYIVALVMYKKRFAFV